jgi:hypothetical protein
MLSTRHHLGKRLQKESMEDMLELTKKSCERTIFFNSKSNMRIMERGTKNLRWCIS